MYLCVLRMENASVIKNTLIAAYILVVLAISAVARAEESKFVTLEMNPGLTTQK